MSPKLLVFALLIVASPALGFDTKTLGQGSLHLDEIMHIVDQSPELKREVTQALNRVKKKDEDIFCMGMRFGGEWEHLGGERVAPYACDFERQWLRIDATVTVTDARGRVIKTASRAARRTATNVKETDPTWKWSDTEPELP